MDAVLIANEIVDERRRSGRKVSSSKLTLEKAYDHVRWDFLDQVLEKKGFSPKWRKWMSGCLSSVSYAVLVNGSAKGWVKASRGLRQGDPLSPFLFTLVADVLSRMFLRAEERNMLEGFRGGRFADSQESFVSIWAYFWLKVNLDKSNIYGINLDQAHLSRLAETLEYKASGWPILYLGLPLGGNPRAGGFWDPVIERISRRLDGWQRHTYPLEGR
ncbi:putative mitochondrial protein [Vitis vinifera]|uniref:Putative mitochondrial protein n=1 Tax=Vitis vinifera TaxID=29760 RepID=A0A438KC69_VITVI|nr:putative mitochondrial protein [Vitis vinifera]